MKTEIDQREQNAIVPFPREIVAQREDFEKYLLTLTGKDYLFYDHLPDEIIAPALDGYANWISELTSMDPAHRERAAFVFLDADKERLIFPVNPAIGSIDHSRPVNSNNLRFIPLVRVHSHPNSSFFSAQDLKMPMAGEETAVELLSTTRGNVLLVRTRDTALTDPRRIEQKMEYVKKILNASFDDIEKIDMAKAIPEATPEQVQQVKDYILVKELEKYGAPFSGYYLTALLTLIVAREYNLGTYLSDSKGQFKRITQDFTLDLLVEHNNIRYFEV